MKNRFHRAWCLVLICIIMIEVITPIRIYAQDQELQEHFEETQETLQIAYAGNTQSELKINTYLDCYVDIVRWLESHEKDRYYLGTPFYDGVIDKDLCLRPQGLYKKNAGMNCVGFVASVFRDLDADLEKITSRLYGGYANASNWNDTVGKKKLHSYRYESVEDLLKSGKLEKGDIVYFEPDWKDEKDDCHIGIFWGDTPYEDVFWHSTMKYTNAINFIHTGTDYQFVYLLFFSH